MGTPIKCPFCGNEWVYKGNKIYACCTSCHKSVKVKENTKETSQL